MSWRSHMPLSDRELELMEAKQLRLSYRALLRAFEELREELPPRQIQYRPQDP